MAAHGREPRAEYIALAALAAVRDLDRDRDAFYIDFIHAGLGEVARAALEILMNKANYEFQSDFARKYFSMGKAEGKALGEAQLLLKLLRFKGFTVSPELTARVESCQDIDQLDRWAERVLTATSLDDIFPAAG
ncbi:MAG: hypothetical protein H0T76_19400 [Nannocystis sp.]|nr:hypothetical protein [Nannocystis sp.]